VGIGVGDLRSPATDMINPAFEQGQVRFVFVAHFLVVAVLVYDGHIKELCEAFNMLVFVDEEELWEMRVIKILKEE
jgi:hypothetical protein